VFDLRDVDVRVELDTGRRLHAGLELRHFRGLSEHRPVATADFPNVVHAIELRGELLGELAVVVLLEGIERLTQHLDLRAGEGCEDRDLLLADARKSGLLVVLGNPVGHFDLFGLSGRREGPRDLHLVGSIVLVSGLFEGGVADRRLGGREGDRPREDAGTPAGDDQCGDQHASK